MLRNVSVVGGHRREDCRYPEVPKLSINIPLEILVMCSYAPEE